MRTLTFTSLLIKLWSELYMLIFMGYHMMNYHTSRFLYTPLLSSRQKLTSVWKNEFLLMYLQWIRTDRESLTNTFLEFDTIRLSHESCEMNALFTSYAAPSFKVPCRATSS
jgi:hypothetical protein